MLTGFQHNFIQMTIILIWLTSRILPFFSGYILPLLKAVCSPLKKILAVNIKLGMRLYRCSGAPIFPKIMLP